MFQPALRQLTIVFVCFYIFSFRAPTCFADTPPIQFAEPVNYSTTSSSNAIVTADFDGNGNPDLAVVRSSFPNFYIDIFFGNGDGTFQPQISYLGTGSVSSSTVLRVADFNGDGKPDLVVNHITSGLVSIIINNGDGTFHSQIDYATGGDLPSEVVTADFNNDGKIDLAIANEGDSRVCAPEVYCPPTIDYQNSANVTVLMGNGDGTFQPAIKNSINGKVFGLAALDADADGRLDLVASNGTDNNTYLLKGVGNGTFQSAQSILNAIGKMLAVDLNSDGHTDLLLSTSRSALVDVGNGNFLLLQGTNEMGVDTLAKDLNNDDAPELISVGGGNTFKIRLGNGDGTFSPTEIYTVGGLLQRVVAGDFDKDGRQDIAIIDSANKAVDVLLNKGFKMVTPTTASFTGMDLNVTSSPQIFEIFNSTASPLSVSSISLSGIDSSMFSVNTDGSSTCVSLTPTLSPNERCTFQVFFTPLSFNDKFANLVITSNHPVTPTFTIPLSGHANPYRLNIVWNSTGTGTITVPPYYTYQSGPRVLSYSNFETVILQATPGTFSSFGGWSGCDTSDGNQCSVTMNTHHTVMATFDSIQPIALESTSNRFFTLGSACDSAEDNSSFAVMAGSFTEQLQLSRPKSYKLRGGCDSSFASCSGTSSLIGSVTISNGTVTIENFLFKGALNLINGTLVPNQVTIL